MIMRLSSHVHVQAPRVHVPKGHRVRRDPGPLTHASRGQDHLTPAALLTSAGTFNPADDMHGLDGSKPHLTMDENLDKVQSPQHGVPDLLPVRVCVTVRACECVIVRACECACHNPQPKGRIPSRLPFKVPFIMRALHVCMHALLTSTVIHMSVDGNDHVPLKQALHPDFSPL